MCIQTHFWYVYLQSILVFSIIKMLLSRVYEHLRTHWLDQKIKTFSGFIPETYLLDKLYTVLHLLYEKDMKYSGFRMYSYNYETKRKYLIANYFVVFNTKLSNQQNLSSRSFFLKQTFLQSSQCGHFQFCFAWSSCELSNSWMLSLE